MVPLLIAPYQKNALRQYLPQGVCLPGKYCTIPVQTSMVIWQQDGRLRSKYGTCTGVHSTGTCTIWYGMNGGPEYRSKAEAAAALTVAAESVGCRGGGDALGCQVELS